MRILVTGGFGFIGKHLCRALAQDGHEILVLDDFSVSRSQALPEDIVHERNRFRNIWHLGNTVSVDLVIHLAAYVSVRGSQTDHVRCVRSNVTDVRYLINWMKQSGSRRIIFASSGGAVYGPGIGRPFVEEDPCHPISIYGMTKLMGEHMFEAESCFGNLDLTILRLGNVYGPGDFGRLISNAIIPAHTGKLVTIYESNRKSHTRDYIYINDVVEAFRAVISGDLVGTYNVAADARYTTDDIVRICSKAVGQTSEIVREEAVPWEVSNNTLSSERFRRDADWSPLYNIYDGIKETARDMIQVYRRC